MIKKWCWFWERIGHKKGKMYGYIFNPYLKSAQECLNIFNVINETNLKLKDVFVIWEN
jgi:hypothetical protein